jgi:hypothetical protein
MGWLAVGTLVQLLADLVVGVRLLALARRTRKLPETAFGVALVLLGGVGYPLSIAARSGVVDAPSTAGTLLALGLLAQNAGCAALYVFLWRVFRPRAAWALGIVGVALGTLAWSVPGEFLTDGFWGGIDGGFFYWAGLGARAGAFVWATAESGLYHARMRRRLALGLADPVVTDRFRLWTIASASVLAAFAVFSAARASGIDPTTSPVVLGATSAGGLVAGVTLWLAFMPPRAYLARITRGRRAVEP